MERLAVSCAWTAGRARAGKRSISGCARPTLIWTGTKSLPAGLPATLNLPEQVARFRLVGCKCCGADLLKPDVVFFGENVPRPRVQRCFDLLDDSACLLVLGSSLTVMSGLRFVHRARQARIPVAIVNPGATRGDALADVKVDAALGEVLPTLAGAPR
jgi:NAD-dependent SIR2 family protein deacetylase